MLGSFFFPGGTGNLASLTKSIGKGIVEDVRGRLPWYKHDWIDGYSYGIRLLAPATYIFFASVIPALAFGQQLFIETDGQLSGVQVLIATAITGTVQALVGGQPLLIIGVAEPIVLIYSFMYSFAKGQGQLGARLFLPWAAWVCIWTAAMILVLSCVNVCHYVSRFTRLSGELFGFLIAVLFMQQAIKGCRLEGAAREYAWDLVNGLWSIFLAFGLTLTALLMRTAHRWRFGSTLARQLIADYGAPLMVVAWSALSYALRGAPDGVPRRVDIPDTWKDTGPWSVARDLGKVPGAYIAAALLPAAVIALLFFFDHSVSAQLAQQPEFNLRKPPAYHYDFLLLGFMTLGCGLIGVPPVNGVLPQAPMHTKSLATLRQGHVRRQLGKAAKEAGKVSHTAADRQAAINGQAISAPADGRAEMAGQQANGGVNGQATNGLGVGVEFHFERDIDTYIPVEVTETRITGLVQSLLVAACLGLTMGIRLIPSAVLWGYFAFMALESLSGSQFWERLLYLATDPAKRYRLLEQGHAPYVETLPYRAVAAFTLFQLVYLLIVYGITWIPIAGFLFPLPIIALIPIRTSLLPKVFSANTLRELDAAAYEEAPPLTHEEAIAQMEGDQTKYPREALLV
ncbi:hypothetical protein COCSUDRAFT_37744 [Coccomyxa subellipsoidea C-169]|uniref:Bicarbonate transporter-like transmembrane domain-containing protein n=1 Tax=Coccomyxa subellipsoidea (strain C-169) TaxID=574566 RepID=I0YPT7_COCSC|nr:hypothetical protein COCSUDRAFT_37744 [Coccomyxa subellipsoidea C-169]EIE20406.1 hypothetical protein COCSUDRAFT_37744 [Coccomyxa subellipsoidea C-169]|eukprot:XP_005644950.1 hypothetical protein COCSUDRAFT_37744 [Coccomyxa subellipsoidea C-169]